jgi:O-antigen ligase
MPKQSLPIPPFADKPPSQTPPTAGIRPSPLVPAGAALQDEDIHNPLRRVGFFFALAFVFVRFTTLHEVLTVKLGFNPYLLYWVGGPAVLFLILTGGLQRSWYWTPVRFWLLYLAWMYAAVPTSTWRSDSLRLAFTYSRTEMVVLFLIAGLVLTWQECWRTLRWLALAAFVLVLLGHFFSEQLSPEDPRLQLVAGTMSNSNDYAALMVIVLPFLVLFVIAPGVPAIFRLAAGLAFIYGLYLVLATGSRGALIALVVTALYALFRLPLAAKIAGLALLSVLSLLLWSFLPDRITTRLRTISATDENVDMTAAESASARMYLLKQSLRFTFERPLFGVGPGQFANFEGASARQEGEHGSWHDTHNAYTQVSSEAGIPAFLFYVGAIFSTGRLLSRVYKRARSQPPTLENRRIAAACLCVMLAFVGFATSVLFLSLAYRFYLPALSGLTIAMARATDHLWSTPPPAS